MGATKSGSKSTSKKTTSSSKRKSTSSLASSLSNASGIDKKIINKGISKTKRLPLGSKVIIALCLIIGIVAGYFGVSIIQNKDQFRLIQGENINLNVNDEYNITDLSKNVVCVSYGRDVISSVELEIKDSDNKIVNSIDTSKEGTYTLTYTSTDFKYKKISLVQVINISLSEPSYDGE